MELNLHPIATKCFVSGRAFQENDRVVSYLVREAGGEVARRDLREEEDQPTPGYGAASGKFMPPAFVYCRWVVAFKQRKADENPALALKLTAENLFLTLAVPAGSEADRPLPRSVPVETSFGINTGPAASPGGGRDEPRRRGGEPGDEPDLRSQRKQQ